MKSNKYKATVTLGVVSLGFFASYPFSGTFLGGLVASGCEAAMVGGLADWFAVTALFKKPLGIPYRTALIPRNKERIFNALSVMVENELLTKENLKNALGAYDISSVILHFIDDHGGRESAIDIVNTIIKDFLDKADPAEVGEVLTKIIKESLLEVEIAPVLADCLDWIVENGYADEILDFFIRQFIILAEQPEIKELFTKLFLEALEAYERGLNRRIIFNHMLNFSPVQIAEAAQLQIVKKLYDLQNTDNSIRHKARAWLKDFAMKLRYDIILKQKVEAWKTKQLAKDNLRRMITELTDNIVVELAKSGSPLDSLLTTMIKRHVDKLAQDFSDNKDEREKFDKLIKKILYNWVEAYHGEIGSIVKGSLSKFSDSMLADFVEERVGNDLQMIRINGSVVGGLAGIVIYLMTFWL